MYGEVQVPYTNIGGSNMRSAEVLYNLSGSTEEPAQSGEISTTIGVRWSLPGGIMNGGTGGTGFWGYAIYSKLDDADYTIDQDVIDWIQGKYRAGLSPRLTVEWCGGPYTEAQINAEDPVVVKAVNNMVKQYINHLQSPTMNEDFNSFKTNFSSCYYQA